MAEARHERLRALAAVAADEHRGQRALADAADVVGRARDAGEDLGGVLEAQRRDRRAVPVHGAADDDAADDEVGLDGAALRELPLAVEHLEEGVAVEEPGVGVGLAAVAGLVAQVAKLGLGADGLPLVGEDSRGKGDEDAVVLHEGAGVGRERADEADDVAVVKLERRDERGPDPGRGQKLLVEPDARGRDAQRHAALEPLDRGPSQVRHAADLAVGVEARQHEGAGHGVGETGQRCVGGLGEAGETTFPQRRERRIVRRVHVPSIGSSARNLRPERQGLSRRSQAPSARPIRSRACVTASSGTACGASVSR